ncbi:MAG: hypothetical protein LBH35_08490 [Treponema sp.]|jgi:hypothetical protein|nr:hypothetical protein [Treponema sp.]
MNFEYFSISRDLFYLASFFTGAALGCFLDALSSVRRGRSGWISAGLCFLSCAAVVLSGSLVLSTGAVFTLVPLLICSVVFFAVGVLALRFLWAGLTLVIVAGLLSVFAGVVFLRHPRLTGGIAGTTAENSLVMTLQSAGGGILVRKPRNPGQGGDETWNIAETDSAASFYFEAVAVEAHPLYPVFGGERRGFFLGAGRGDETFFSVKSVFAGESSLPGFSPRYFRAELPVGALFPGANFSVIFSGETLDVVPGGRTSFP